MTTTDYRTTWGWATWQTGTADGGLNPESKAHLMDDRATVTACGRAVPQAAEVEGVRGFADRCRTCNKLSETLNVESI